MAIGGAVATGVAKAGVVVAASGFLLINGVELTRSEFISVQYATITGIRNAEYNAFKDKGLDETVKYLMAENTLPVAARLLRNDNYVNSLQAQFKSRLRGDSENRSWNDVSKVDAIYYLAADTNLVIKDKVKTKIKLNGAESTIEIDSYKDMLNEYITQTDEIAKTSDCVKRTVNTSNFSSSIDTDGKTDDDVNWDQMLRWYCQGMSYARVDYEDRQSGNSGVADKSNIVSTLAKIFKEMAWTSSDTSWKPTKPVIQGALLYAILVAQSLIFFIAYAKRLFYVIILILIAPVVVVYDFFTKFSS